MAEDVRRIVAEFTARNKATGEIAAYNRQLNTIKTTAMNVSRSMLAMAGVGGGMYAIKGILTSTVSEFASVDKTMAKISTMLDDQSMYLLPKYRTELDRFTKKYGESFGSLGEGLYDILSAQVDPTKALKLLESSTRSAIGGFTDAGTVTALTTSILKAYGWQVEKTNRVQDILHATVRQGKFRFEDLGDQLGNVIGLAAKLNVDLEAVGAALATMTKAGVPTNKMVMALRNIFNQFLYPSEAARLAARELGFELDSTSIQGNGLVNVMDKLSGASAKNLKALMPTMRGITGFAALLKNAKTMGIDYEKIVNNIGLANENLAKATENASWKIDQLKMKWKSFKVGVGEGIWDFGADVKRISEDLEEISKTLSTGTDIVFREPGPEVKKAAQEAYRKLTGELKAFTKTMPIGLAWSPGEIIRPKDEELYRQIINQMVREANEKAKNIETGEVQENILSKKIKNNIELAGRQIESAREQMEYANKVADNWHKNETKKLTTTIKLYDDIGNYGIEYQGLYERLLDEEVRKYGKTVKDEVLLEKWKQSQLDNILQETVEKTRQQQIETLEASNSIADGFRAGMLRMEEDLYSWGQVGSEVALSVRDSMAGAFYDMTMEGEKFWNQFLKSFYRAMVQMASMQAATGITMGIGGLMGVGVYHGGGEIGRPSSMRLVSPDVFSGAERAHNGLDLRTNEVPIIATRDEVISKPGKSTASVAPSVVIYNQSGTQIEQQGEPKFDGEKWVVSLIAKNVKQGGKLRKLMR